MNGFIGTTAFLSENPALLNISMVQDSAVSETALLAIKILERNRKAYKNGHVGGFYITSAVVVTLRGGTPCLCKCSDYFAANY